MTTMGGPGCARRDGQPLGWEAALQGWETRSPRDGSSMQSVLEPRSTQEVAPGSKSGWETRSTLPANIRHGGGVQLAAQVYPSPFPTKYKRTTALKHLAELAGAR